MVSRSTMQKELTWNITSEKNWTTQQKEPNNNKRNQTVVWGIEQW
jgi:hypothetical protein